MQSSIRIIVFRLQSQMSSELKKSPSSSFETNHPSRTVSFNDDNDVGKVCYQPFVDSTYASSPADTVNGAMGTTSTFATTGTAPDSAIGKHIAHAKCCRLRLNL